MYLFEKNPFSTWDLSVSCWTEIRRATISFAISFFLSIHRKKSTVPTVNLSAETAMTSVFSSTVAVGAALYACPHDLKNRIPHRFFIHIVGRWTFLRNVRTSIKRSPYSWKKKGIYYCSLQLPLNVFLTILDDHTLVVLAHTLAGKIVKRNVGIFFSIFNLFDTCWCIYCDYNFTCTNLICCGC